MVEKKIVSYFTTHKLPCKQIVTKVIVLALHTIDSFYPIPFNDVVWSNQLLGFTIPNCLFSIYLEIKI